VELAGKQTLHIPKTQVWEALNDPAILRQCVPGCDSFAASGENQYDIVMTAAVGPVKAKFKGRMQLSDIVPPDSYALSFDGSGGSAGFGKGTAAVRLEDAGDGATELAYTVQAKVGGRLSQVGARLIDGVAKKMADDFFRRFRELVEPPGVETAAGATSTAAAQPAATRTAAATPASAKPRRAAIWAGGAVLALLLLYYLAGPIK